MRAAMITRYQQPLEIVNLADPKLPKDGIIMRVRATGVCRSDWHTWMGHYADQITLPLIPGHEMAGDVVEVGSDVTGLVPGDRVTVPFGLACGRCYTCLDGNHQSCITQVQPSTDFNGSFAELIALPRANINVVKLPDVYRIWHNYLSVLPEYYRSRRFILTVPFDGWSQSQSITTLPASPEIMAAKPSWKLSMLMRCVIKSVRSSPDCTSAIILYQVSNISRP